MNIPEMDCWKNERLLVVMMEILLLLKIVNLLEKSAADDELY